MIVWPECLPTQSKQLMEELAHFDQISQNFGGVDILISNAGFAIQSSLDELTKKQLDSREFRIRMKERDLISEALMRRSSAPNEQQAALIRSQRFFELGLFI